MLERVKSSAAQAMRKAALLSAGLFCCVAGMAFLTLSAWILLSEAYGALTAASVIGSFYSGVGLILIAVALSGNRAGSDRAVASKPADPPLMQAFLAGLETGSSTARRRA